MRVIQVRNVNQALPEGLHVLQTDGVDEDSRAGKVRVAPYPVTTVYTEPTERVLFSPLRDANPFFHFMEGLWMLAGRRDIEFLSQFTSGIARYSDDGTTLHGAYGYRWRRQFGIDQLDWIIAGLREEPGCRRQYLQMWSAKADLGREGKDFPCNVGVHFLVRDGRLDMTVFNRSNDIIWGAYGANAVHMSMLQEYVAMGVGVGVGRYYQVSDNFHAYHDVAKKLWTLTEELPDGYTRTTYGDRYEVGEVEPLPMGDDPERFEIDLRSFFTLGTSSFGYRTKFFRRLVVPMMRAWHHWQERNIDAALLELTACGASDWRQACEEWLLRRV